jgi:ABC-2 type transport system permease protein
MSRLRIVALVARRDFMERLMSRAFQLSTAVIVLVVVGLVVAPSFFDTGAPSWNIGVVGDGDQALAEAVVQAAPEAGTTVDVVPLTEGAIGDALDEGDVDIAVNGGELTTRPQADPTLISAVSAVVGAIRFADAAAAAGLEPAQTSELLAASTVEVREHEPEGGEQANVGAAFIASVLLFVAIVTYGQWILAGVVEEKANRVVEVVLGAVRPHLLLAGKILGIGTLGVIQLLFIGVAALAARAAGGTIELPTGFGSVAWIVLLWFVLGYAFYATAFAASGSLVSRIEDAQNAAFPLTLVLMIGYFVAAFSFGGDNAVLRVMSLLPPFAPVTMSVRMAAGAAPAWEVALSIAGMLAATWVLIRFAGRIYAGGLLRGGGRTKVREAWTSAER